MNRTVGGAEWYFGLWLAAQSGKAGMMSFTLFDDFNRASLLMG